ncbi:hypothetical protein HGRIS_006018 [Hohenbuehelia grisea]|uniref:Protein kinase domain-containing protein n=1 Tax=Hohenbuehelia grisea TaxID=104357 RepID=A0ABR3JZG3_9AGAR
MSSTIASSSSSYALPPSAIRRNSPPRTPVEHPKSRAPSSSPSDDSSIIDDLSFEYVQDADGNYVRLSKGSSKSNHSTPPTPEDYLPRISDPIDPNYLQVKPTSPTSLTSPLRRGSLSRSESAYPVLNGPSTSSSERALEALSSAASRSFQRVASVPSGVMASTGASVAIPSSAIKPRPMPRRVTMEDQPQRGRIPIDELNALRLQQDEKENIHGSDRMDPSDDPYTLAVAATKRNSPPHAQRSASLSGMSAMRSAGAALRSGHAGLPTARPLADVPVPQRSSTRPTLPTSVRGTRAVKSAASVVASKYSTPGGFGRISEVESCGYDNARPANDDTDIISDAEQDRYLSVPASAPAVSEGETAPTRSRNPQQSLSSSGNTRPRRSASLSDALSQDEHFYNQYAQQNQYKNGQAQVARQPQSRPGTSLGLNHPANGEARRITLEERERNEAELKLGHKKYQTDPDPADRRVRGERDYEPRESPSPTSVQHATKPSLHHKRRDSDTLRSVPYFHTASTATAVDGHRPSPIDALPPRLSPRNTAAAMHRRSPTAPEPPTNSGMSEPPTAPVVGKTWAAGDHEEDYQAAEREHGAKALALQQRKLHAARSQSIQQVPTPQSLPNNGGRQLIVNKKVYARLDMIGKGGSSRVYRVLSSANELYAIKRVSLDKTDAETMNGYMNEIALLKRLDGNARIIRLIDSEVRPGSGSSKGWLLLVMECGEIDFARLLSDQQKEPMNLVWIAYYWQQMLQAVHVIHEEKIVHSDLKPANFVLVRGQLKLIDFGIANAIANDTTNIQRDHQIGTVNYMSPEAIECPEGMRRLKVGRQSDVWSLGCILYQMVYGQPPFYSLSVIHKMKAIPDQKYAIDFPEYSTPSIPSKAQQGSVTPTPPKRLDHLKRKVRSDVIQTMERCLCRPPKERITIPEIFEENWLTMREPDVPEAKIQLAEDETLITPFYMRQLLEYGIKQGQALANGENVDVTPEALLKEAERLVVELRQVQEKANASA